MNALKCWLQLWSDEIWTVLAALTVIGFAILFFCTKQ